MGFAKFEGVRAWEWAGKVRGLVGVESDRKV
jgi:hypothetical protein